MSANPQQPTSSADPSLTGTPDAASTQNALNLVQSEVTRVLTEIRPEDLVHAAEQLATARRIFVAGAGRSGLSMRMAAMRLMHLGLTAHVAGDVTTPAIAAGDLLLVASAAGTTVSMVQAANTAHSVGASVLLLTTAAASPLAGIADAILHIPAAAKTDTGERSSHQYAGSLFEQAVLLVMDALFHTLWQSGPQTAEDLLRRHANLE